MNNLPCTYKGCNGTYPNCVYTVIYHNIGTKKGGNGHKVAHNHGDKPCVVEK